jgi:hypothetical protein
MSSTMMIRSDGAIVKITRQSPTRGRHCAGRHRPAAVGGRAQAAAVGPGQALELLGGIGMDDDPPWQVR